jgi:hypothetical protein
VIRWNLQAALRRKVRWQTSSWLFLFRQTAVLLIQLTAGLVSEFAGESDSGLASGLASGFAAGLASGFAAGFAGG